MFKFFRRIRQGLLKEGKFYGYLVYAIGEIILIIIGILIALQISNWNEIQKLKSNEVSLLKEIGIDLDKNIGQIEGIIFDDDLAIRKGENLLIILKDTESVLHDSLKISFGIVATYIPFQNVDGAYINLKQKGLDIIQDDSLKIELRNLFEVRFPTIEKTGSTFREKIYFQYTDVLIKYMETETNVYSKKPNSFVSLKENQEYINMLTYIVACRRLVRDNYQYHLDHALKVKSFLDEKIQQIE